MVNSFSKFDILDYPIDSGKVLIEAAAGTGSRNYESRPGSDRVIG